MADADRCKKRRQCENSGTLLVSRQVIRPMPQTKSKNAALKGHLVLLDDDQQSFAASQIELLTAVDACGSISAAAKQAGISYKTAWDRIDALNNMSEKPLVVRSAGGARGGGTTLTDLGKRIVEGFQALQEEHEAFVEQLGTKLHSVGDIAGFIRAGTLKSSARNQYRGVVTRITPGAVNAEVELRIGDQQSLVAIITDESLQRLNLAVGASAVALIKASWVLLSKDVQLKSSARNRLIGRVSRLVTGAVNSDVTLDLGAGKTVSTVITNASVSDLGLRKGDAACAFFKASSVILMADPVG